jgi:hypothetical protein
MGRKRKFSPEAEKEITDKYMAGGSSFLLGEEYSCREGTIINIVKRNGGKARSCNYRTRSKLKTDEKEIIKSYIGGNSTVELAREYCCAHGSISRILRKHDVCVRSPSDRTKNAWKRGRNEKTLEVCRRWGKNQSGKNNSKWNGGFSTTEDGRVLVRRPDHPLVNKRGYVRRSHLVWEENTGHIVVPPEVIHHLNGDVTDDTFSNLFLCKDNREHMYRFHGKSGPLAMRRVRAYGVNLRRG